MKEILQEPHIILRGKADPLPLDTISTPEITSLLQDMYEVLDTTPDAVALAAPQIGVPKRIFVISKKVIGGNHHLVCINPTLISHSRKRVPMDGEGCLSVRWKYGTTRRYLKSTLHAWDHTGYEFTLDGEGLLSQIFQHELDHLDGILFIDHAESLHTLNEEERLKLQSDSIDLP
jgi:peptide deformylase